MSTNLSFAQQSSLTIKKLYGNWFLQQDNNQWIIGFYNKLVYFKNEYWDIKTVAHQKTGIRFILQKDNHSITLRVNIQNDSSITVTTQDAILALTNKPRRMASSEYPLPQSFKPGKDSIWIRGFIDHRNLTSLKLLEIGVYNFILGNISHYNTQVDKNGLFVLSMPIDYPFAQINIGFGPIIENLFGRPGDTAIVYFDLLPYTSVNKEALYKTNNNMVFAGTIGNYNNEYRNFKKYKSKWDDFKGKAEAIIKMDQSAYLAYELERSRFTDSLLCDYRTMYTMSEPLWKTVSQENRYGFAQSLLRYRWLHERDKIVILSPDYLHVLDSVNKNDSEAYLAGTEFDGFTREILNMFVVEHLNERKDIDRFITSHSSLIPLMEYIERNDKGLSGDLIYSIDSLKKSGAAITAANGHYSIRFREPDTAKVQKLIEQYNPLMKYLDDCDYLSYYYSGWELMYGISKIDSLFPKGTFRDYLLGHYIFTYFLEGHRLNPYDESLSYSNPLYHDTLTFTILKKAQAALQQQFEEERYESLYANASTRREETVLNKIARQNTGKVIYVDLWATWCTPCIEQFPYSMALKKQLEGKPVEFVYLCADSDKTGWQKAIKKYGLSGQHLLLTQNEISALRSKYNIDGYPRYMIINKEGKLVSSNSLMPQQTDVLVRILESLIE